VPSAKAAADGWWTAESRHWKFVHSDKEFKDVVDNAPNLVLVDCFTPWCGGCKMIYPQLCRMAMDDELKKQCTFVKIDTDEMKDWAGRESIKTLPYMVFYRAGEGRLLGMQMSPVRVKLLRNAITTLSGNRGKTFRLDPNGYVVPVEPSSLPA
jgi:thiol-disulfide isomerase/thioredoxin